MFSALGSLLGSIGSIGASVGLPLYMMNRQNSMNMRNSYELTAYQYELQKKFQKYLDVERPSAVMEGYRRAGVNPLFAVGSIGNPVGGASVANGVGVNAPNVDVAGSARAGAMLFENLKSLRLSNKGAEYENKVLENEVKASKAETQARIAESDARESRADLEHELNSLKIEALHPDEVFVYPSARSYHGNNTSVGDTVRQAFRNSFERERYLNSKEHAIAEDIGTSAKGALDAVVNLKSLRKGAWKRPSNQYITIKHVR